MRKRVVFTDHVSGSEEDGWLELIDLAEAELSSEEPSAPIESAFTDDANSGWRAKDPGQQTIRFTFDAPQRLRRIRLLFREPEHQRVQEFVLRWAPDAGGPMKEIVRQQFCFSPPGTVEENEEYRVDLDKVKTLELTINPNISDRTAVASLARLQLA